MTGRPSLEDLVALFATPAANGRYDEAVTEREHALQCAGLAAAEGAPDAAIAAALLHDVGHLLGAGGAAVPTTGDDRHEELGARWLRGLFGPEVTAPVALHVEAKRYLCATDPAYAARLSPSSTASLAAQGGPMTDAEVRAFEQRAGWRAAVQLRRWDDRAKVAGAPTVDVETYRPLLAGLLRT